MSAVHFVHDGILFLLLIYGIIALVKPVVGSSLALCEGGHTCLLPKECCAQGCCYLYAPPGAPRVPLANNEHVLSMLFLNHWYFWCFVLAIILALLCTCSLWKRRRQLCGWDTSARHSQSEGDSAGSCYAPPQYSRCNSFHIHAPPPYTEVASKPDLYPLVFSYTDPGKGTGANYLMVQYFRNYIVQPVGSISGTSTVDSLSSSFICNANEANTLVPPPYSRAASPDHAVSFRSYLLPRSASQQVCLAACDRSGDSLLEQQCVPAREQQRDHGAVSSTSVSLLECQPGPPRHHRVGNLLDHGSSPSPPSPPPPPPPPASATSSSPFPVADLSCSTHRANRATTGCLPDSATNDHCDLDGTSQRGALVCKLCCSMGDIATTDGRAASRPSALHKSLETCCHVARLAAASEDSMLGGRTAGAGPRPESCLRGSCVASSAGSNVSSLVNLDASSSPPRATSPTAEVRELLEQIRQLHGGGSGDGTDDNSSTGPARTPVPATAQRPPAYRRPSSLIGRRGKLFTKPACLQSGSGAGSASGSGSSSKAMYIPIAFVQGGATSGRHLRSPASMSSAAGSFLNRGRSRYCWMSKSAPTTPGAAPGGFAGAALSDNRPLLLTEQEEDGEQNV
ncbi:uncharacterized protein LOC128729011 [Anopheles nili]|uniref:uncharacterized protein LOC128729011 n=1 Tax=Anopheles nili TaxID=185578 RepID=UPI00237A1EA9|nr:uncharacterized protein LOC128729011 [Anopheles nili]